MCKEALNNISILVGVKQEDVNEIVQTQMHLLRKLNKCNYKFKLAMSSMFVEDLIKDLPKKQKDLFIMKLFEVLSK